MTADNCATMFVKLQLVSHRGFDKKMKASFCGNRFQDVFDLHDSAMIQCVTVSLIDDEHASDLVQAVCVDSSSDYTRHGPCYESQEGRNEGNERSEGDDQGSAFG